MEKSYTTTLHDLKLLPAVIAIKRDVVKRMQKRNWFGLLDPIATDSVVAEELFDQMLEDVLTNNFVGHYSLHDQICCGWFSAMCKLLKVLSSESIEYVEV